MEPAAKTMLAIRYKPHSLSSLACCSDCVSTSSNSSWANCNSESLSLLLGLDVCRSNQGVVVLLSLHFCITSSKRRCFSFIQSTRTRHSNLAYAAKTQFIRLPKMKSKSPTSTLHSEWPGRKQTLPTRNIAQELMDRMDMQYSSRPACNF